MRRAATSLDFSHRARSNHALRAFHGGDGSHTQIVGSGPEPDSIGPRGFELQRNQDVRLPRGVYIVRLGILFGSGDGYVIARKSLRKFFLIYGLGHFQKDSESAAMKNWWLYGEQSGLRGGHSGKFLIMAPHAGFQGIQRKFGARAVARNHVERHLGIEDVFGQGLKRQQIDGLLVQLVHAFLALFGGWLENSGYG